jgi:hypothetical protein
MILLIPVFIIIAAYLSLRNGSRGGSLACVVASAVWLYVVIFHFHSL